MRRSLTLLLGGLLGGTLLMAAWPSPFVAAGTAVAAAYDVAANCAATGLHFVIDGGAATPQVAGGGPAGFICGGSAYAPVRWLAGALGQSVAWDGATHTITLASAPVQTGTEVVDFAPHGFTAAQTVSGDCWTGSIAAPRAGAYRCTAHNAIFDPCFVTSLATTVDCPDPTASPDLQAGTVIQLTQPLPAASAAAPNPSHPWRFELADGAMCGAMTGTLVAPDHPYGCAPVATGTASAGAASGLYCTAPALDAAEAAYTVSCAPLSPQRAANGAPQLAAPATYTVAEMWL